MTTAARLPRTALVLAAAGVVTLAAGAVGAPGAFGVASTATVAGKPAPRVSISPTPQQQSVTSATVRLAGNVQIVAGAQTDAAAITAVEQIVRAAGAVPVRVASPSGKGTQIIVGTAQSTPGLDQTLTQLGSAPATGLPADGYVLTTGTQSGRPTVALQGVDARGTFYAAQTLRQIVTGHDVAPVAVRDWPLMSIRGAIEGFYGTPWSHQARLDQFAFYGKHKMNTYIYTPKDDPLLREQWRTPYSGADLARIKELVATANANHVDFTFALSPGNDICYSSQADFDATTAKFDQLRSLGVNSFYIALDDIPLEFHCDADTAKYPDNGDWHWLADAQADYLNRVQREYLVPGGMLPLQTVPTNYAGSGEDPYKGEFGDRLDDTVKVQWTGEGVFSDTITVDSVTKASHAYRTDHLYIWDNFPVNDGRRNRLFLNPLTGRDPNLYQHIDGFTSNPMIQPYASMPALANYGDYTWNGPAYDADASMAAALRELAGPDAGARAALNVFADLNQSWPYRSAVVYAPKLNADITAFWAARASGNRPGEQALRTRLQAIIDLPRTLASMSQQGFVSDAQPWIEAAGDWARGLQHQIAMLDALDGGNGVLATDEFLSAHKEFANAATPRINGQAANVGDGAFEAFAAKAGAAYRTFLGATAVTTPSYPATGQTSMSTYSTNTIDNIVDGNLSTLYWSAQAGDAGSTVGIDLGAVKPVGEVRVHQSDSDTQTGDMIYHAALEYSVDGVTWITAGTFEAAPLITFTFNAPVQARYVRIRATADNPGGQWVKIREFSASPAPTAFGSNLAAVSGSGPALAFDADATTAYTAASSPVAGSYLAWHAEQPTVVEAVTVVGTARGEVQVERGGGWTTVSTIADDASYHRIAIGGASVTGARILFTPGSSPPVIREFVVR